MGRTAFTEPQCLYKGAHYMRYIPIVKVNKMHYFSTLFGKEHYVFRTDLLSIIRSLNTVFTATGVCHTGYVDCLLARSGWNSWWWI